MRAPITSPSPATQILVRDVWFTVTGVLYPVPLAPELDTAALIGWPAAQPAGYSLSAYGFFDVRISMRSGVPTSLNSLRKRPSRKRL